MSPYDSYYADRSTDDLKRQLAECIAERDKELARGDRWRQLAAQYKVERKRLREALESLPLIEYAAALREGCDHDAAFNAMSDAIAGHIRLVLANPLPNPVAEVRELSELKAALRGCPHCNYDEAEGLLVDHCDDCCRRVTTAAYGYMVRMEGRDNPIDGADRSET